MGVGVGVRLSEVPAAILLEPLNDQIVCLARRDQPALYLRPRRSRQSPVRGDRSHESEAVLYSRLEVVGAEGGSEVDQTRTVVGRHEIGRDDNARHAVTGQRNDLERAKVAPADKLASLEGVDRAQVVESTGTSFRSGEQ